MNLLTVPGVAGHVGGDDSVTHSDGDVALVEEAIHPLVRENIS